MINGRDKYIDAVTAAVQRVFAELNLTEAQRIDAAATLAGRTARDAAPRGQLYHYVIDACAICLSEGQKPAPPRPRYANLEEERPL